MNAFSVEDRTRTYQNLKAGKRAFQSFDDSFEGDLPPEIRAELVGGISPSSISRPPIRTLKTEQEIQQSVQWLKSQGYLRPSVHAPPPVSPAREVAIPTVAKPVQRESRSGSGIWWLLAVIIGLPLLLARLSDERQAQPQSRPVEVRRALLVEVRRALPAVPRAIAVTSSASDPQIAREWQPVRLPDGTIVQVSYQGELPSSAALPPSGRFIGEAYSTGKTLWVWMTPAGTNFASWVDP